MYVVVDLILLLLFAGLVWFVDRKIEVLVLLMEEHERETVTEHAKIWNYLMERAFTEAMVKGLVETKSPISVKELARPYYHKFINELKEFYQKVGVNLSEPELFKEIATRFKQELQEYVCIPLGLQAGACVLVAMELVREAEEEAAERKEKRGE